MKSDWLDVFAESEVRWEWSFMFREFQIGIVTLQGVKNVTMLIKGIAFCLCVGGFTFVGTIVQVLEF
jgi:hypothetical protein